MTVGEFWHRWGRGHIDQDKVGLSALLAAFVGSPLVALAALAYELVGSLLTGRLPNGGFNEALLIPSALIGFALFGIIASALAYLIALPIVLVLQAFRCLSGYAVVLLGTGLIALPGAFTHNFSFFFSACGATTAAIFWWSVGVADCQADLEVPATTSNGGSS